MASVFNLLLKQRAETEFLTAERFSPIHNHKRLKAAIVRSVWVLAQKNDEAEV